MVSWADLSSISPCTKQTPSRTNTSLFAITSADMLSRLAGSSDTSVGNLQLYSEASLCLRGKFFVFVRSRKRKQIERTETHLAIKKPIRSGISRSAFWETWVRYLCKSHNQQFRFFQSFHFFNHTRMPSFLSSYLLLSITCFPFLLAHTFSTLPSAIRFIIAEMRTRRLAAFQDLAKPWNFAFMIFTSRFSINSYLSYVY